jgi:hypothetical protein
LSRPAKRALAIAVAGLVVSLIVAAGFSIKRRFLETHSHIATIPLERRVECRMYAENWWEHSIGMNYEVVVDGNALHAPEFFGYADPYSGSLHFSTIAGDGVVGIMEDRAPSVVLVMLDLRTMIRWPTRDQFEPKGISSQRTRAMLARLQESQPKIELQLSTDDVYDLDPPIGN